MSESQPETARAPLEITVRKVVDAPASVVAERCARFATIHEWHPAFASCAVEGRGAGAVRTLDLGGAAVREQLVTESPDGRSYYYGVLKHPFDFEGRGFLAVSDGPEEGRSTVSWSVLVERVGVLPEAALGKAIEGLCTMGLTKLALSFDARLRRDPP